MNYKADNMLLFCKSILAKCLFHSKKSETLTMNYSIQRMDLSAQKAVDRVFIGNDNTG